MRNKSLRKSLYLSLLGHLTIFSIVSLSFGSRIPKADFTSISFWGTVLSGAQVCAPIQPGHKVAFRHQPLGTKASYKSSLNKVPLSGYYLKPHSRPLLKTEKKALHRILFSLSAPAGRKEPMILFHPLLPYGFSLYFKDRQVAHVELMFNIGSRALRNSIAVKRKISSGNLEVDLLCMRYIGRYLFIEQARFAPDKWQTVKIDLSRKDD
ncbi:MAG: hypothetical protein ISS89_00995 [Candidatus Omnitrophica bacterium]|nr:hypothetical protein [Candidatus Omnitrophota bacterium]